MCMVGLLGEKVDVACECPGGEGKEGESELTRVMPSGRKELTGVADMRQQVRVRAVVRHKRLREEARHRNHREAVGTE